MAGVAAIVAVGVAAFASDGVRYLQLPYVQTSGLSSPSSDGQGAGASAEGTSRSGADGPAGERREGRSDAAGSPGNEPGDSVEAAARLCEERLARLVEPGNPFNAGVVASFSTTAGEAVSEHEARRGPGFESTMRERDPGQFAGLCFFEADAFGIPYVAGPGGPPLPAGVHTRLMEVVFPDGEAFLLVSGRDPDVEVAPFSEAGSR